MATATRGAMTPGEVVDAINSGFELTPRQRDYLRFHARRFAYCTGLVASHCQGLTRPRVLDVAPHFTTYLLRRLLPDGALLNSLGWMDEKIVGKSVDRHFPFDLNDVHFRERWIPAEEHDVLLAGEIIEHLFTSPERFLGFVTQFLAPGGTLILCTPNAASIRHRVKLALGINPFEMINERRDGHVREYTADELRRACAAAELVVERVEYADYWPERGLLRWAERLVPAFRRGITIIARKPGGENARGAG